MRTGRISAGVAAALGVAALAAPIAAPALQQTKAAANPTLSPRCGLKLILILDASYSIQQSKGTEDVRNGAKAFVDSLAGTGAQVAMFDFATRAVVNVDVPYTEVTAGSLTSTFNPATS